ncbi:TOBE domain-containing protein [Variovorax sp. VNK109]|uniref:TOBE domain-containing protein n=1 Tax=Variovorax sp. VNK109 TaxID=3400919 RepID=UPI003C0C5402
MPKPLRPADPRPAYTSALGQPSADKRIDILRLIARSGSISQAGRDAGVSYKAAWQAIDTLTNLAGVPLVERVVGGTGGGGAQVTEAGRQLLAAADELDRARAQVLARLQSGNAPDSSPRTLSRLAIRTSMRNQLPCTVASIEGQGQIVRVILRLPEGDALLSSITRESAELLGLVEGLQVLALCKATAVSITRTEAPDVASNTATQLEGRASRVSRGETGDEVAVSIGGGLQLVGFAPPGSGLRTGSRVALRVEASAVVIALAE